MKPAAFTAYDSERKCSSGASQPESVTSQIGSPIASLNCLHRATTDLHPFAPLQPSAVTFNAGIAFDYINFPRIVSVCWPECNTQAGTSVVVRDELQMRTNKTAFSDIEVITGASVFNCDPTRTERLGPPIDTTHPVKKEHMGGAKENTPSTEETTTLTLLQDERQTQKQREHCRSTDLYVSTKVEANLKYKKNSREKPIDFIQEGSPNSRSRSREASQRDVLDCAKPKLHMKFCALDDDKQGIFKAQSSFIGVRRDDKKLSQSGVGNVTNKQFEGSVKFQSSETSMGLKESTRPQKDNMASFSCEDSYGSIAVRPATKEKRLQNHLQKDNARENVRDLVRRIRFIKSRLDRAESDFRKKRMLKAIVGLRKKVKSLIEGMRNDKAEQGKSQQKTGASCLHKKVDNSKETAQENNKNMNASSIVISATDGKLVTDQVIVNIDGDTKEHCNYKQNSGELTNATKIEDEYRPKTSYNYDIQMKNDYRRKGRGSLTLIKSNVGNESFLRLPFEVGLDLSSPCKKRSASSSDADQAENGGAKKVKVLSLSGQKLVARINTNTEEVTCNVRSVTQSGVEENNVTPTDDCAILARREFVLCYPDFTQCKHCKDEGYASVKMEPSDPPLDYAVHNQANDAKEESQGDKGPGKDNFGEGCQVSLENRKEKQFTTESTHEYHETGEKQPEYSQVSECKFCAGINYPQLDQREEKDNAKPQENQGPSLERILQDEEKQGFTSPRIYNPSGRQEDIDLIQSLQIREARIRNLARKRERLLNLAEIKFR